MKINAISNAYPKAQTFTSRHESDDDSMPIERYEQPSNPQQSRKLRNALRAMALTPLFIAPALTSCQKTEVYDECGPVVVVFSHPTDTIQPGVITDTLYAGHLYNLPSFKQPVKNSNGETVDSVRVPSTQAYVPNTLKDNMVQPVMTKLLSKLGIDVNKVQASEGKKKATSNGLPLQFTYSDPASQTVTSVKLDGFRSTAATCSYNSMKYNSQGSLRASHHYNVMAADENSLYIEESDNFNNNASVRKSLIRLENGVINRYDQIDDKKYQLVGSYSNNGDNSVVLESEDSKATLKNIKVKATAL
ncbi:MAG: hypothetical protein LKG27_05880 [Clostridiaceae bacterium]|jgi:hypothetical protein|nr:hypothetical protein [Clostridiaceae bacterium]